MNKPEWITDPRAKGGGFWVTTLEPSHPTKVRAAKHEKKFAILPLQWAADISEETGTRGAMVWILLRYMSWKTKSPTFPLSTALVNRYGIAKETKRRILTKLEAAGWVKIQHRHKQAPVITLLR
jgi:hypothetical protein